MKFTVNKTILYDALQIASKGIGKNVIPALENFLFTINGKSLTISASNLEVWISTTVELAEPVAPLSIMVPSTRIMGLLKELPDQNLQFNIEEKQTPDGKKTFYNTTIKAGKGKFTIPCEPGEDFPSMNTENTTEVIIPANIFREGIEKTLFAADKTDTDMRLAGVCVMFSRDTITFTGCDKTVLSTFAFKGKFAEVKSITIPIKALSIIQSFPLSGDISVSINERNISFDLGTATLKSILIDEKYPDFKAIIPVNNDKLVKISRAELVGALKRASQFANSISNGIRLNISEKAITVNSWNQYGESATEDIDCSLSGDPMEIWINGQWVLPILNRMIGSTVFMHLSAPNRAIIFKSDDTEVDAKTDVMLAMPINGIS